jgi:hypothetical protein
MMRSVEGHCISFPNSWIDRTRSRCRMLLRFQSQPRDNAAAGVSPSENQARIKHSGQDTSMVRLCGTWLACV